MGPVALQNLASSSLISLPAMQFETTGIANEKSATPKGPVPTIWVSSTDTASTLLDCAITVSTSSEGRKSDQRGLWD